MRLRRSLLALAFTALGCTGSAESPEPQAPPEPSPPADPEVVAVDWLGRGVIYAAEVRERRGELTHVEYADGDEEWVESSRIRPWPDLVGSAVMIWSRRGPLEATIIETRGFLVHARFEDGSHTWFGRDQLYALQGAPPQLGGGAAAPSFPLRRGVDPSQIRVGAKVLCYWLNAGELMAQRPWTAEITAVEDERVAVRYLYDDSVGTLNRKQILHVFEDVGDPPGGARVWLAGTTAVGTMAGRVGPRFRVTTVEGEQVLERDAIIGLAPPVPADRLTPGTHMTVLWGGSTLYHGTVEALDGDQVTVAWHDGSPPSPVPIGDVLDTWQAAD
jgi:hypothetical protein